MSYRFMYPVVSAVALAASVVACSSVPDRNNELDVARGRVSAAQRDSEVRTLAADELTQASESLSMAEKAFAAGQPQSTVDHLSYMTVQRVVIARETAAGRASQAVIASAASERDQMRLAQRTYEVDVARKQLATAEQISASKSSALVRADAAVMQADQTARMSQARADNSDARANMSDARATVSDAKLMAIEAQLQELGAQKTERGTIVTLGDVLFDSGKAQLMPDSGRFTTRLAEAFKRNPALKASIDGYTDSVGNKDSNYELSDRRAASVKTALMNLGVSADQLVVHGYGERNPMASNATAAGRQLNRRVEVVFAP